MPAGTFSRLLLVAVFSVAKAAHAEVPASLYFFGDSLTDEGRNGPTAPVIWSEVHRNDLSIIKYREFAIGAATSGNQANVVSTTRGSSGRSTASSRTSRRTWGPASGSARTMSSSKASLAFRRRHCRHCERERAHRARRDRCRRSWDRAIASDVYYLSLNNAFKLDSSARPLCVPMPRRRRSSTMRSSRRLPCLVSGSSRSTSRRSSTSSRSTRAPLASRGSCPYSPALSARRADD